jgi:hypothetical protein
MALLAAQGVCILVDEIYFHRARRLPRWELLGHPLDTIFYLGYLLSLQARIGIGFSAALGLMSSLIITKDEWIHRVHAPATESWLHAMLFLLHPALILVSLQLAYRETPATFSRVLAGSVVLVSLFLTYQISEGVRRWKTDLQIAPKRIG